MNLLPYRELACVIALGTQTVLPTWVFSDTIFLVLVMKYTVRYVWTKFANLLLTFCAVVLVVFSKQYRSGWRKNSNNNKKTKLPTGKRHSLEKVWFHALAPLANLCF
jgi:ABC-type Fe3+ transport system permease subunit